MKITLFILSFIVLGLVAVTPVLAATATPSSAATASAKTTTATPAADLDPISKDLVDRVIKSVEQNGSLRRTYSGPIKSVGTNSYVVTTSDGDHTISTGDVTSFYRVKAGKTTETNFAGIKKGEDIVAIGTIDPANGEMTAKEVISKIARQNIVGKITAVDEGMATISVGDKTVTVDLNDATTLKKVDATGKIVTAKLADFKADTTIFVMAYVSDPDSNDLSSLKALLLTK